MRHRRVTSSRWWLAIIGPAMCLAGISTMAAVSASSGVLPRIQSASQGMTRVQQHGRLVTSTLHFKVDVNGHGQTYGSADGVSPSELPDLIAVIATNGTVGYITKTAFLGTSPTLQQVLNYPRDANGNYVAPSTTVPVYASNGIAKIGTFTIGNSGVSGSFKTSSPGAPVKS